MVMTMYENSLRLFNKVLNLSRSGRFLLLLDIIALALFSLIKYMKPRFSKIKTNLNRSNMNDFIEIQKLCDEHFGMDGFIFPTLEIRSKYVEHVKTNDILSNNR